ncbi:cobyric acid synthase [Candidatus Alkanophaga liquidiphilum]|nr:Cobyric acid synthase [Candidatus Alkanophaga liquidiphilum]
MAAKPLMVQGTGSHVGKSVLVAAFCRIFSDDGFEVAPFKAQNMALNSFVTRAGHEIGRAQAVQALAARKEPTVEMNPILLKPTSDVGAQVVFLGKPIGNMTAREYHEFKPKALAAIKRCYEKLAAENDIIVIEGAGSPAEINLKANDIVNMTVAKLFNAPVLLVGDIDRGGVFAWLLGTLELLEPDERELVRGFIINKFRGDLSLLESGLEFLERRTGKPVLGVVPYFRFKIHEEDSVALEDRRGGNDGEIKIDVIMLPHVSNFTDFDALEKEPDVSLRYVSIDESLRADADAIILPGTKNTIYDLLSLRQNGLAAQILRAHERGKFIVGICGGFQMLGRLVVDESGVESAVERAEGLSLLDAITFFDTEKTTHQVIAVSNLPFYDGSVEGYEIHMGRTLSKEQNAFTIIKRSADDVLVPDGAFSACVLGTYIHGIFDNHDFRRAFINYLRQRRGLEPLRSGETWSLEVEFEQLATVVRRSLQIDKIYEIIDVNQR